MNDICKALAEPTLLALSILDHFAHTVNTMLERWVRRAPRSREQHRCCKMLVGQLRVKSTYRAGGN